MGKSTVALAYSLFLQHQKRKVRYYSLDQVENYLYCRQLEISYERLSSREMITQYIGQKLHSRPLATWICQTDFFQATFDLIPALAQLLFLGQLVEALRQDPDLYLVLDAPASGHTRSMFEASQNFRQIFQSGILFQDICQMQEYLRINHLLHILIVTTPQEMAWQEAGELASFFTTLDNGTHSIILNQSLDLAIDQSHRIKLPEFLQSNLDLENQLLQGATVAGKIPFFPLEQSTAIIQQVVRHLIRD